VDLRKPPEPLRIVADGGIGIRMKIAMAATFVTAEDDYWEGTRRDIMKEILDTREFVRSGAEIPAKQSG
jgi:hypothetical protein